MTIDYFSLSPMFLEMFVDGGKTPIGIGTGFTVQYHGYSFLITNWHNVTGRHPETNKPLNTNTGYADPDFIHVWFNKEKLGQWNKNRLLLKNSLGEKHWIEHPHGNKVDVVALPFVQLDNVKQYPIDLALAETKLAVYPSKALSIIGFPNGLTSGGRLPIWKKGHIASEPEVDFKGKPLFLIDATTRNGMSGSPVILKESGLCEFEGNQMKGGTYAKFMGIYSGRLDGDSEIGMVWKPRVIQEILDPYLANKPNHSFILQEAKF